MTTFLTFVIIFTLFQTATPTDPVNLVPLVKIPSTNLSTGVFYIISMKSKPSGVLSWTYDKAIHNTGNFLQLDLTPENQAKYLPGGEWNLSAHWVLQPFNNLSSFVLKNRDNLSRNVATVYDENTGYTFLYWDDPAGPGNLNTPPNHYFVTPVGTVDQPEYKIQLQFPRYPGRFVTWTPLKYQNDSHYLQVAAKGSEYDWGGRSWDSTLFKFEPVTSGVVIRFGHVASLEISPQGVEMLENKGTMIKTSLPDTSGGILTITNPTLHPHIKLPANFTFALSSKKGSPILFNVIASSENSNKTYLVRPLNRVLPLPPNVAVNVGAGKVTSFRVQQKLFKEVELPCVLNVPVTGEGDRMTEDWDEDRGPLPPDVVETALRKKLGLLDEVRMDGDQLFVRVGAVIKGTFLVGVETTPSIV
ncbi:hypothetical protein Fcan01_14055 [Folsomia candida]|uniref:Uncharacterized protein n=1 Tax=Folsomia candida TaxID=158441 RepID=A0A226DZL5_FOLCA|nr:hypothetical protein Fcan01_14055 [Folsomia candida]